MCEGQPQFQHPTGIGVLKFYFKVFLFLYSTQGFIKTYGNIKVKIIKNIFVKEFVFELADWPHGAMKYR